MAQVREHTHTQKKKKGLLFGELRETITTKQMACRPSLAGSSATPSAATPCYSHASVGSSAPQVEHAEDSTTQT